MFRSRLSLTIYTFGGYYTLYDIETVDQCFFVLVFSFCSFVRTCLRTELVNLVRLNSFLHFLLSESVLSPLVFEH